MSSLRDLIDDVRLTFHALAAYADREHVGLAARHRAVLEFLARHGGATVPDIARARGVSRQHIQVIVNELLELDLAEAVANPTHRRSHRIQLTEQGAARIHDVLAHEDEQLSRFERDLDAADIHRTIHTLRQLRLLLEDPSALEQTE